MFCQQFTGLLHPVNDAGREFRFAKISSHRVRELTPKFIAAFCVDGFVADDGKFMCAWSYKN